MNVYWACKLMRYENVVRYSLRASTPLDRKVIDLTNRVEQRDTKKEEEEDKNGEEIYIRLISWQFLYENLDKLTTARICRIGKRVMRMAWVCQGASVSHERGLE